MIEEGVIENKDLTLRQVLNDVVSKVLGNQRANELIPTKKSQKPSLESARGKKAQRQKPKAESPSKSEGRYKSKKSSKKFKGI